MKKLLLSFVVLPGALAMAQVGVNTDKPRGTLDAAYVNPQEAPAGTKWADPTTPQGLHFPNVSTEQRSKFEGMSEGMMIYNTDKKCLEVYLGVESGTHQWECIPNVGNKSSQSVSVSPASFSGQFMGGVPLTEENTVSFTITNNGFSEISSVDLSDAVTIENEGIIIEVNGSANSSISLNGSESKTLTYKLSGTPKAGTLTAIFNKLGLRADQQLTVGKGNAKLQNQEEYIVSFAHGSTNIQGYIDNRDNQVRIKIPYTNGKGSYDAVNITQTTAPGQGGATKQITLSIPAGNFAVQGALTATLKVEGDENYPVKQLALGESYNIATYNIDINGSIAKVILKGIGGIPDRMFGKETNGQLRHQFIYLPVTVTGENGYNRTWLNLNLGAEYANINSTNFNPAVNKTGIATHKDDKTYGSLYQWQRASDGHEFRDSEKTTQKAPNWTNTGNSAGKFINEGHDWVVNGGNAPGSDLQLWRAGEVGVNNPCPSGYHVPTVQEWQEFLQAVTGSRSSVATNQMWIQKMLPNFAAAGGRNYPNGSLKYMGFRGLYWTGSAYYSHGTHYMGFTDGYSGTIISIRAYGFSVRCIKDNN